MERYAHVMSTEQDDLLEVLAEIVTQLMMGGDRLEAEHATRRNERAPRGADLFAQKHRPQ